MTTQIEPDRTLEQLIDTCGGVAPAGLLTYLTYDEGLALPPIAWLDPHRLIPERSIVFAYGPEGSHKTGWALATAIDCIEAGKRVLFIAGEGDRGIATRRLPALVCYRGIDASQMRSSWLLAPAAFSLRRAVPQLIEATSGFRPDLIVFDTASYFLEGDWNMPNVAAGFMAAGRQVIAATGASLLFLAHPGKELDRGIIGSSQFKNLADAVFAISMADDQVICAVEKQKDGERGRRLARGLHSGLHGAPIVGAVENPTRNRSPTDDDAILSHLVAAGATSFPAGIDDRELAQRIVGEPQSGEDIDHATRVSRTVNMLKKRHRTTRYGESATMPGGSQLFWRWHTGEKIANA